VRLRRLEDEMGDRVRVSYRSFLLRPQPDPTRTLDRFRDYTRSWLRPAADPDGGTFRVWSTDVGPPSHSVPPHLVAKAAATLGHDAFRAIDERLFHAYFAENRDVTDPDTLRAVWREAALPDEAFARSADPALVRRVIEEHNDAVERGITGVPTVVMEGREGAVVGARPYADYRRWVERALAGA
jgi:predicted DsbA family dithiol-disulfide isomerase